jgi:hypothetical protein
MLELLTKRSLQGNTHDMICQQSRYLSPPEPSPEPWAFRERTGVLGGLRGVTIRTIQITALATHTRYSGQSK